MPKLYNLARETTATTGTAGTVTLGGAVAGRQTFLTAGVDDGDMVSYGITDGDAFEVGRGLFGTAGTTLTRGTILDSSAGYGTAIDLSGTSQIYITALAEDIPQTGDILQVELYRTTLGTAGGIFDTTGVDITGYDHLIINMICKTSETGATNGNDTGNLFFNNDTTASNYRTLGDYRSDTSTGETESDSSAFYLTNSYETNYFCVVRFFIPNYGSGLYKYANFDRMGRHNANIYLLHYGQISWESTDPITRITIQPDGYDTDNFIGGSFFQVIGVKAVA